MSQGAGNIGGKRPLLETGVRRGLAELRSVTAAPVAAAGSHRAPARPRARLGPETKDAKVSALSRRPFISVLLPVRGESEELIECLASLARQTYPRSRFEILIADGSDRPVDPVIFPVGLDIHVYQNKVKTMSPGLNMLARQARGERLAIVSAHTWLPDDYLERMVATAHVTGAANVGARVRKVARSPWGRAIAAATSCPFGVGSSIQHHGAEVGPADSAFPGFIARLMFERLGGFNTDLACNEDDEFNARVRAAGGLVWYDPGVEVSYRPRETLAGVFRQHFRYGRWKVAVARLSVPAYLRVHHAIPSLAVAGAVVGAVASIIWRPMIIPTAGAALVYCAIAIYEARKMAAEHGASMLRTVLVFPVIHAAYGLGFIRGLLDRGLPDEGRSRNTQVQTRP
jgi:cellulose synthase/poly-beta-1,6-N-acetylglucosamine synthase-like glycosyltransferase